MSSPHPVATFLRMVGVVAVLGLAASTLVATGTWHGAFETTDDPRTWEPEEITQFVHDRVNPFVERWRLGDSVTVCQRSAGHCIVLVYVRRYGTSPWVRSQVIDGR